MKELTIEEHKKLALDILIDVADFCEKNGIRYFLAYGTLIGRSEEHTSELQSP